MDRGRPASLEFEPGTTRTAPAPLLQPTPLSKGTHMFQQILRRRAIAVALTAAAASASIAYAAGDGPSYAGAQGARASAASAGGGGIHLFTPTSGDVSGIDSKGFFIDLKEDMNVPLERSGFGGQGPAPGAGKDSRNQSLIVLMSTAKAGAGQNLAGLFDIVG